MRTLDRYLARQLIPVWAWCILVFVLMSCLIDLFERLDDILRYRIPFRTVLEYYLNFVPLVFVRASPLALLLSTAFVAMRLVRHQEFLAMSAGGMSLARASVPFVFIGWLVSLVVFGVNEGLVPETSATYERLRFEMFQGKRRDHVMENVATLDGSNRLYHARLFDLNEEELADLTVIEHDAQSRPKKTLYARRALFTPHGWVLLNGTVTHLDPGGALSSEPEAFVERVMRFPVTPQSFRQPDTEPEILRISQLRRLITQLRGMGITDVRHYTTELASKITLPLMNVVVCLIGFIGSTRTRQTRGHLRGLGTSLVWGVLYYIGVAAAQGIGKEGLLPVAVAVWLPHLIAVGYCMRALRAET